MENAIMPINQHYQLSNANVTATMFLAFYLFIEKRNSDTHVLFVNPVLIDLSNFLRTLPNVPKKNQKK